MKKKIYFFHRNILLNKTKIEWDLKQPISQKEKEIEKTGKTKKTKSDMINQLIFKLPILVFGNS